jgi:penicillin-binding protein 2
MISDQGFRIAVFRVLLVFVFLAYSIKLFSMQILSGDVYLTRAQDISKRTYSIPTQRGEIFDRNITRSLAANRDTFGVSITPAEIQSGKIDEVIEAVSQILNISPDEIKSKLPSKYNQFYQPLEIASNVPFSVIAALAERKNSLPGISWQSKFIRNYADIGSLSHIIGYVGDITRDELTTLYNRGYQQGDIIGKAGIEKQYDEFLRGRQGWETRTVDSMGRHITGQENTARMPPEMGKNLILTIDLDLQTLVEKALGQRIGSALVLRPSTGEILAMVSYPWYNPNVFTEGLPSDYRALVEDPNRPFINRAIQSSYPPASTFKIIMTTGVLAENAFPTEQTILCRGLINYGNRDWHCHVKTGHGRLNLRSALAQSCNIFYWTIGRDYLGVERIVSYSREYGYGEMTGIDLPGEISGFLPTPQWKERRYHERWVLGDTMNMSTGQGYTLVTPIQMANMISMVVNNGKIYKPHILKEVRDPITNAIENVVKPQLLHESKISPDVFAAVRQDMRGVIREGTAQYPLNIRTVEIAGKTGTGEAGFTDRWHSWFASYAPFNSANPEEMIVVSIIVEAANTWEWWAPYASAIIYQGYFANQDFDTAVRSLGFQYLMPVQGRRE